MRKTSCVLLVVLCVLTGCSFEENIKGERGELVYSTEVSPNETYIEKDEDRVVYTIQIYQNDDYVITVCADSNSDFFESVQYEIVNSKHISETDVSITWTTLMGNPEPSEDDLWALAKVSISLENEVVSERTINFISGAIKVIFETIDENSK